MNILVPKLYAGFMRIKKLEENRFKFHERIILNNISNNMHYHYIHNNVDFVMIWNMMYKENNHYEMDDFDKVHLHLE